MKIVSVILARGGSKGIPKKNITKVINKPLISYTIETSINSNVDETWVCTDNEEIAKISEECGAKVLIRPHELATDKSKSEDALIFFSKKVEFDFLVFIQPTSPLLKPEYINLGIEYVKSKKFDSVFSAYSEHWIPRWSKKEVKPYNWEINKRPRRQDVEELWVENGAFYITTKKDLQKNKLRYNGKIGVVEMPFEESFQIDTISDLKLIEKLL
jgi:N-acylneuraminate cytidylyltransferase